MDRWTVFIAILILCVIFYYVFDLKRVFHKPRFTGREKAKHVVMISLDGIYEKDFDELLELPAFQKLAKKGAYSKEVATVYPTLTYPVHTSIITGVHPNKHGIIHNNQLQPGTPEKDQTWYWYREQLQAPTLYDKANENNLITAGTFWPVSGKSKITYNMPEVVAIKGENQIMKILNAGSKLHLLEQEIKHAKYRDGINQPQLDQFSTKVTADTIRTKKPNLSMTHLIAVDAFRHDYGVNSEEAVSGIEQYNESVLQIIQATKDAGIYNDTVFVITTDHGLIDIDTRVYLNNIFLKEGLIQVKNGRIVDYQAYAQTLGLGAYIYCSDEVKPQVQRILEQLMEKEEYGIEQIYSEQERKELHIDSKVAFAIEAKAGVYFKEELTDEDIVLQSSLGKRYATHGYSPNKEGYRNVFMIAGEPIKKNFNIGPMNIVDIAPTVADVLGMDYYECDGKVLKQIYM